MNQRIKSYVNIPKIQKQATLTLNCRKAIMNNRWMERERAAAQAVQAWSHWACTVRAVSYQISTLLIFWTLLFAEVCGPKRKPPGTALTRRCDQRCASDAFGSEPALPEASTTTSSRKLHRKTCPVQAFTRGSLKTLPHSTHLETWAAQVYEYYEQSQSIASCVAWCVRAGWIWNSLLCCLFTLSILTCIQNPFLPYSASTHNLDNIIPRQTNVLASVFFDREFWIETHVWSGRDSRATWSFFSEIARNAMWVEAGWQTWKFSLGTRSILRRTKRTVQCSAVSHIRRSEHADFAEFTNQTVAFL